VALTLAFGAVTYPELISKMKDFVKENWFKLGTLFLFAVIAVSATWYYLTFRPHQDQVILQGGTTAQMINKAQQLQDCVDKAKQDFADSYASLCNSYQTSQHELGNPNWQCPLTAMAGVSGSPYPAMVSKEQSDEELCATLYK
jgi:hypothetical protein